MVRGAKLGGITIGNPLGAIMASIGVAIDEGGIGGIGGKVVGLGSCGVNCPPSGRRQPTTRPDG